MSDITMCNKDIDCPFKHKCYRYKAPVNEYRQAYFTEPPYTKTIIDQTTRQEVKTECQYFIQDR